MFLPSTPKEYNCGWWGLYDLGPPTTDRKDETQPVVSKQGGRNKTGHSLNVKMTKL
jgi:hypothetical protein